jgi:hypothetical protein
MKILNTTADHYTLRPLKGPGYVPENPLAGSRLEWSISRLRLGKFYAINLDFQPQKFE